MRFKQKWTLGGLMVLIALMAVPLAFHARQLREVERTRAQAELNQKLVQDLTKRLDSLIQADALRMLSRPAPSGGRVEILTPTNPPRVEPFR